MTTGALRREGAVSDPGKPGNQPWEDIKPRGAVRMIGFLGSFALSCRPNRPGVWPGETGPMSLQRIVEGLEQSDATGCEAQAVAKLGFLEWVFSQPGAVSGPVVREALDELAVCRLTSDAACAFAEVMRQAAPAVPPVARRGGRLKRAVH